jgi:hypothetical protein
MTRREVFVPGRRSGFVVLEAAVPPAPLFAIGESGRVLWVARQIPGTHAAYASPGSPPWVAFPYTPRRLVGARLAGVLLGGVRAAGRPLSLVSTVGTGVAIGLTIPFAADSILPWASLKRVEILTPFTKQTVVRGPLACPVFGLVTCPARRKVGRRTIHSPASTAARGASIRTELEWPN